MAGEWLYQHRATDDSFVVFSAVLPVPAPQPAFLSVRPTQPGAEPAALSRGSGALRDAPKCSLFRRKIICSPDRRVSIENRSTSEQ